MRLAVMQFSAVSFDVDSYRSQFGMVPDALWRAGEADNAGRPHADSGMIVTLADALSNEELVAQVFDWLDANRAACGLRGSPTSNSSLTWA
jgi:hypothetical protein